MTHDIDIADLFCPPCLDTRPGLIDVDHATWTCGHCGHVIDLRQMGWT